LDLNAAIDQAAFAAYGWTDLDPLIEFVVQAEAA
jgi:hypothetical protein